MQWQKIVANWTDTYSVVEMSIFKIFLLTLLSSSMTPTPILELTLAASM